MTASRPARPAQPPPTAPADPLEEAATRDAVLAALASEHAAIWSYGLVSAFLTPGTGPDVTAASTAHRARRDAVLTLLGRAGIAPVPAAASYRTPAPVTDPTSAAALAAVAEEDVAAAWRAVCERTGADDGAELRGLGIDAIVESARVGVRWRLLAGTAPAVPVFPGAPSA